MPTAERAPSASFVPRSHPAGQPDARTPAAIFLPPLGMICCVAALLLFWIDWAIVGGAFVAGLILLRSGLPFNDDEFVEYAKRYDLAEDPSK